MSTFLGTLPRDRPLRLNSLLTCQVPRKCTAGAWSPCLGSPTRCSRNWSNADYPFVRNTNIHQGWNGPTKLSGTLDLMRLLNGEIPYKLCKRMEAVIMESQRCIRPCRQRRSYLSSPLRQSKETKTSSQSRLNVSRVEHLLHARL